MADLIRLKANHSLKSLLSALGKSKELIVYLEIPSGSALWDIKNLRLIRRAGIELKKKIVVITPGRVNKIRAEQAGLTVVTPEAIFKGKPLTTNLPKQAKSDKPDIAQPAPPLHTVSDEPEEQEELSDDALPTSPAEWVSKKSGSSEIVWLQPSKRKAFYLGAVAMAVLAGFLVANFALSSAEITVYSRVASAPSSMDIVVREPVFGEEFTPNAITGGKIVKSYTKSSEFDATGEKNTGDKAKGNVYIQSSHPSTLTLRADTTYLESAASAGGKRYRFTGNVTGLRSGVPYLISVEAEEGGSGSDLAAGTRLEVHNSAFGYRPQVLYATVAETGISGGGNKTVKVVSESDMGRARESLLNSMIEEVQKELRGWGGDIVLLSELTQVNVIGAEYDANADDTKEKFSGTVNAEIKGLWFDQAKLVQLVETEMKRSLPSNQQVAGVEPGSIKYIVRSWDFDKGIAVLNVTYNILTTSNINEQDLRLLLAGKKVDEIRDLLLTKPEIKDIRIDFSPFWSVRTPKDADKIKIRIESGVAVGS